MPASAPVDATSAAVDRRPTLVAAIDCGTNSTRLLVARTARTTLERLMRITRLGQGVDATGALDPDAIERTVDGAARVPRGDGPPSASTGCA